jgi:D-methionine transport system substrate-binding protein
LTFDSCCLRKIIHAQTDSPYANLVAARPDNVNSPAIAKLVAALRSPAAKQFVKEKYHRAVLTTF